MKFKTPFEAVVRIDHLLWAFNADRMLADRKFFVDLACGHKHYSRSLNRACCPRCTEMLRRSIETGDEDYEGYRQHERQDCMIWREDVCRQFNERTDLEGNFINP